MREKPPLLDEDIRRTFTDWYGISIQTLEFLPIGNDARSFVYRAETQAGERYFVKARRLPLDEPALALSRCLYEQGIQEVVAPLPALDGSLWQQAAAQGSQQAFGLILYPYIVGENGMDTGLTLPQWEAFGTALKKIHTARLPADLIPRLARETFRPPWSDMVRRVQAQIDQGEFRGATETQFAAFWQERREEIERITSRCEEMGSLLMKISPPFIPCHADIHTANLLVDAQGGLHIVDWDQPILAPPERDLMFVLGGQSAEEAAFFKGYGEAAIDPLALAYYCYEWVVQELGDCGERVFFSDSFGEVTAAESLDMFRELFAPGDVVEGAYQADEALRQAGKGETRMKTDKSDNKIKKS